MSARSGPRRVALVTGGSRGIGLAVARGLAADGWRLALLARSDDALRRAAQEIAGEDRPLTLACDVADAGAVERALGEVVARLGGLDLVVHAAGVLATGTYDAITAEEYRRTIEVNYLGSVHVARAAIARMRGAQGGHLVQIASVIAIRTFPGFAAYAPSKWALRAFHETLELELAGSSVRLSLVYPPITDTAMIRELDPARRPAVYDAFAAAPVEAVAAAILRGIRRKRRRIFARASDAWYFHLVRLAPGLTGRLLDRIVAGRSR